MEDRQNLLADILRSAEERDYSGYSKFDALNSPFLNLLAFNNKWLRLIFTQIVKESPFHVRPLLGVRESRNPKGIALFARAYFFLYQQSPDPVVTRKPQPRLQSPLLGL